MSNNALGAVIAICITVFAVTALLSWTYNNAHKPHLVKEDYHGIYDYPK